MVFAGFHPEDSANIPQRNKTSGKLANLFVIKIVKTCDKFSLFLKRGLATNFARGCVFAILFRVSCCSYLKRQMDSILRDVIESEPQMDLSLPNRQFYKLFSLHLFSWLHNGVNMIAFRKLLYG